MWLIGAFVVHLHRLEHQALTLVAPYQERDQDPPHDLSGHGRKIVGRRAEMQSRV